MPNYRPGDLVLAVFPFAGGTQRKFRPALVLLDTGGADVVAARVTTQRHATGNDVALADWRQAELLGPSTVRLHKLATLEKTLVIRPLGHLEPADRQRVAAVLAGLFGTR